MSNLTQLDIANQALAVLDEAPIGSFEEDSKAARLLNLHFETTREAELAKHAWVFALRTIELTGYDTGSGHGTLNWEYDLPPDFLRLLPVSYDNELSGVPISFEQRDGHLYSDQSSPRSIRYIAALEDPDDWDAPFTEVLVAALAIKLALPLTHKTGMLQLAQQAYQLALRSAMRVNAVQQYGALYRASWATQRGDLRHWRA
jgi:hypothetical protein